MDIPSGQRRSSVLQTLNKTARRSSLNSALVNPSLGSLPEMQQRYPMYPYPKGALYILGIAFTNGLSTSMLYGILQIYLYNVYDYSEESASAMMHFYTSVVYFVPIVSSMIADTWIGKYKTTIIGFVLCIVGSILVSLSSSPLIFPPDSSNTNEMNLLLTYVGLGFRGVGLGFVMPCLNPIGAEQFLIPEQIKTMHIFWSISFYLHNVAMMIGKMIAPILRADVQCFDQKHCYPLAYLIATIMVLLSFIIFVCGRTSYKMTAQPKDNVIWIVIKCICAALRNKCKRRGTVHYDHWLDYAAEDYGLQTVSDIKVVLRVMILYSPLPIFWSLISQQASSWVFQARKMNGDMETYYIKPEQMQFSNPLFLMMLIPCFEAFLYPVMSQLEYDKPLRKMTYGGLLLAVAFICAGVVDVQISKSEPRPLKSGEAVIRIYNGFPCDILINSNISSDGLVLLKRLGMYSYKITQMNKDGYSDYMYQATGDCIEDKKGIMTGVQKRAMSYFISNEDNFYKFEDAHNKMYERLGKIRFLANTERDVSIEFRYRSGTVMYTTGTKDRDVHEIPPGKYDIFVDAMRIKRNIKIGMGGSYTFCLYEDDETYQINQNIPVSANSVHMLWQLPQFFLLTVADILFSITGLQFSFSRAPKNMKAVLMANWNIQRCFGNIFVALMFHFRAFQEALIFFGYSILMFVSMIIFAFLSSRFETKESLRGISMNVHPENFE